MALIAALSGIVGAALQARLGSFASSQSKLEAVSSSENEKKALYKFMTDNLESEAGLTSTKGEQVGGTENLDEIRYKRLFQAGFLTTGVMQADAGIWETTLNNLANRGNPWVSEYVPRLKAEYPKIKQLRLRWLESNFKEILCPYEGALEPTATTPPVFNCSVEFENHYCIPEPAPATSGGSCWPLATANICRHILIGGLLSRPSPAWQRGQHSHTWLRRAFASKK